MEPVMGEGEPGLAITREFYDLARRLTSERNTLLIVDSIQAALRAYGCLSIVDYPGFEDCRPPDCETYSKALNAGQYPLSVLAMTDATAEIYVPGVYGNTMTTNPRALEVGCAVLDSLTEELRANIRERGRELRAKLERLAKELPGAIRKVTGTGLMVCAHLDPDRYSVVGVDGFENYLRVRGIAMIHGGTNGLRFTPHFAITTEEIDLIVDCVRAGLRDLVA
jgi:acetylornithine/succinyldiaminopimelate/putrescine aminotransferase